MATGVRGRHPVLAALRRGDLTRSVASTNTRPGTRPAGRSWPAGPTLGSPSWTGRETRGPRRWTSPGSARARTPAGATAAQVRNFVRWLQLSEGDIEHTLRFTKSTLGPTTPSLPSPEQADRWRWLIVTGYTKLRLARGLAADQRLPWERPRHPNKLTPPASAGVSPHWSRQPAPRPVHRNLRPRGRDARLYRAYLLQGDLRTVVVLKAATGKEARDRWLAWATRCRIPELVILGQRIRRHRRSIEAALEHDLSNALIESTTTRIRVLTQVASGFTNPEALIALALLSLGAHRPDLPGRSAT